MKEFKLMIENYKFYSSIDDLKKDLSELDNFSILYGISKGLLYVTAFTFFLVVIGIVCTLFTKTTEDFNQYVSLIKTVFFWGLGFGALSYIFHLIFDYMVKKFFSQNFKNVSINYYTFFTDRLDLLFNDDLNSETLNVYKEFSKINNEFSELLKVVLNKRGGKLFFIDYILFGGKDIENYYKVYEYQEKEQQRKKEIMESLNK